MADMTDILSGGPYAPSDAQNPQMPGDYTDTQQQAAPAPQAQQPPVQPQSSPDVDPSAQQTAQQAPQAPQQAPTPAAPASKWEAILTGALAGLAGVPQHARTFGAGLAGGAQSSLAYQQQQKENQVQQQQMEMQRQRLAMEQQQSADAHATAQQNLALTHVNMQIAQAAYDKMPKTFQDEMTQDAVRHGQDLVNAGNPVISGDGGVSQSDAQQLIMAHRDASPNTALQYTMFPRADGKYNVIQISDPNKLIDHNFDQTIGIDQNTHKPITRPIPANTMTYGDNARIESQAWVNGIQQQQDMEAFKKKNAIQTSGEIAVAKAKQQMDQSPVYAVNPNGETVLTTKAAATQGGMSAIRPVKEADISKDQHDIKVLSDIQTKANAVQQAASAMDQTSWAQAAIAGKTLADNPNTTVNTLFKSAALKDATPQTKAYVIAVNSLRESSMGLQKVLTGSARTNSEQLAALQNTLPGVEPDSGTVKQKLGAFTQNLNLLAQGLPKGTGVEMTGNGGGQVAQPQQQAPQFSKYSSDGKWGWNGSQWVGTGR